MVFWKSGIAGHMLRRVLRNMVYLHSANILVGLIGLANVAVMARALGPAGLGIVALAEAYVRLLSTS